jgi:flagellar biosynthetic protein FliO
LADGLGMLSIKMLISLIIMLGLIFALVYILKRLKMGHLSGNRFPSMRMLGHLSLAPRKGIALVEVCDQWLVIGIGTENINLISKIDRQPGDSVPNTGITGGGNVFQSILENIGIPRKNSGITDTRQNDRK